MDTAYARTRIGHAEIVTPYAPPSVLPGPDGQHLRRSIDNKVDSGSLPTGGRDHDRDEFERDPARNAR